MSAGSVAVSVVIVVSFTYGVCRLLLVKHSELKGTRHKYQHSQNSCLEQLLPVHPGAILSVDFFMINSPLSLYSRKK